MECLRDWIGVLGCGAPAPLSNLYLNSLPGISLEEMAKITNADQQTFLGLWDDVQTLALKQLETDTIAQFKKRYKIKTVSQTVDLLRRIDKEEGITAAAAEYRGFTVELVFKNNSKIVSSAFQVISIQTLSFYTSSAISDASIKIFDLATGDVLDTFTIASTVVGWNLVQVNKRYAAYRIFIGYNATSVDSVKQDITGDMNPLSSWCTAVYGLGSCSAMVHGAKTSSIATSVTDDDITTGDNIFGLTGIFSVQCRYDALACNNKDVFTLPLWYLLGSSLMMFRLNTNRLNRYTTVDKKQAEELKAFFDSEYKTAHATALDGIDLNLSDSCLECHAQLQTHEARM